MAKNTKLNMEHARALPATHRVTIQPAERGQILVHPPTEEMLRKQEEILALVRGLSELARHPARELRPFNCTQLDFDKLPGLVSRSTFLYWTGLGDAELTVETKAARIACYKPREYGKALYFKHEMARLTGFKL